MKLQVIGTLLIAALATSTANADSLLKLVKKGGQGSKAIMANAGHPGAVVDINKYLKTGNRYVVVDYFADWCAPCRKMAPLFKELPEKFSNVSVVEINIDKWGSPVCKKDNIKSVPFMVIYDPSGREVARGQAAQIWLDQQIDAAGDPWAGDPRFK